jgi:cytochrome b subunit of formate dehydrogenase
MGIGSALTGLGIYKPVQLGWLTAMFGGYKMARIIHFALTIGYVLFFVIHIIQVILAGWNNFRAMVAGFEVVRIKEQPLEPAAVLMDEIVSNQDDIHTEGDSVVMPEPESS